ncbi:MAG: hypothetical protein IJ421_09820 [Prevotella sp.]|nr:hypothetical protein [Prevotella sp.]
MKKEDIIRVLTLKEEIRPSETLKHKIRTIMQDEFINDKPLNENQKPSNKMIFALRSPSKCSFMPSKLCFFGLRRP